MMKHCLTLDVESTSQLLSNSSHCCDYLANHYNSYNFCFKMDHFLAIIPFLVLFAIPTFSFPSGAPTSACSSLTPDATSHGASPQTTDVPYMLNLSVLFDQSLQRLAYTPNFTYNSKSLMDTLR